MTGSHGEAKPARPREPLDCEQTVRALWDYLDRTLDRPTMEMIDVHLAACAGCREHALFEGSLIAGLRVLRQEHDDPWALRRGVLQALAGAGWQR